MPPRKPGGTFSGKTKTKREKFYSKKRGFQTICIQVSSWVQGRRKKPLTQLLYWPASLPETFTFCFSKIWNFCLLYLTSCSSVVHSYLLLYFLLLYFTWGPYCLLPWLWSGFCFLYLNWFLSNFSMQSHYKKDFLVGRVEFYSFTAFRR